LLSAFKDSLPPLLLIGVQWFIVEAKVAKKGIGIVIGYLLGLNQSPLDGLVFLCYHQTKIVK